MGYSVLAALPVLILAAPGLVSSSAADRRVRGLQRYVLLATGASFAMAVAAAVGCAAFGPRNWTLVEVTFPVPFRVSVVVDALTCVMQCLIGFLGLIIVRYSIRTLDGEATQGRFLRWMSITLGAVHLLIVSGNLLLFLLGWMLTSLGLHQLLTHYSQRPWAVWAARKKFLISRLGDVLLLAAVILTAWTFGSVEYEEVFARAEQLRQDDSLSPAIPLIGILLVLGAMTKSAQVPFHSWLPDTMEAPTAVSALMHAGIINAGGFLVIRLSPLVTLSPYALDVLMLVGGVTAAFGGVVMLTQTSVKRALAWSTVAQMGFMMLQCGLGAFSTAMLHLVAHSAYKAHAFLSCGSVVESSKRLRGATIPAVSASGRLWTWPAAIVAGHVLGIGPLWLPGINLASKPGAGLLGLILGLAIAQLVGQAFASGSRWIAARAMTTGVSVSAIYWGGSLMMEHLLSGALSHVEREISPLGSIATAVTFAGLLAVCLLSVLNQKKAGVSGLRRLYVHAMHGFYLDIPARRLTALFWGRLTPVP